MNAWMNASGKANAKMDACLASPHAPNGLSGVSVTRHVVVEARKGEPGSARTEEKRLRQRNVIGFPNARLVVAVNAAIGWSGEIAQKLVGEECSTGSALKEGRTKR